MEIGWNVHLKTTAGLTHYKRDAVVLQERAEPRCLIFAACWVDRTSSLLLCTMRLAITPRFGLIASDALWLFVVRFKIFYIYNQMVAVVDAARPLTACYAAQPHAAPIWECGTMAEP